MEVAGGSHITPLFWQHGDDGTVICREIVQMKAAGIGSFIVEPRPHPDYLGPGWWRDLDIILDEAVRQSMQVWLFDDARFPSGYANGLIRDHHPQHLKLFLRENHLDLQGPAVNRHFGLAAWTGAGEDLVAVVAARRSGGNDFDTGSLVDLSHLVADRRLVWDVPDGDWRIYLFISTRQGGEAETSDYLNPLDAQAVERYLELVHEAHHRRYAHLFGTTIAGFFTDEPRFGNVASYAALPGKLAMSIPWAKDLLPALNAGGGIDFPRYLPCLWYGGGARTAESRYRYMDVVSRRFAANFTTRIGDWCRQHQVRLIGHVIEDNGAHARLGYGSGHFFRMMAGLDMAGLDYVLCQVYPGMNEGWFRAIGSCEHDGDFFYWGLTKLASSAALLDPQKRGETMCEIFGAYGWHLGLKLMKWLTDHACVRGVNRIVPHAFSPKFPDPDCPPHFFAGGNNPQWRLFGHWSAYAERVCGLLSGGAPVLPVAVVYHAEAEWGGSYQPFELAVKVLAKEQIDCGIVPIDALLDPTLSRVENASLVIRQNEYRALVVPGMEYLSQEFLDRLLEFAGSQLPIIFLDQFPQRTYFGKLSPAEGLVSLRGHPACQVVRQEELAGLVRGQGWCSVQLMDRQESVRVYNYRKAGRNRYFITNENTKQTVHTRIRLRNVPEMVAYDPMEDLYRSLPVLIGEDWREFSLDLAPFESVFFLEAADCRDRQPASVPSSSGQTIRQLMIENVVGVSGATAKEYPRFTAQTDIKALGGAAESAILRGFSGTLRYDLSFDLAGDLPEKAQIELCDDCEAVELWLNGLPLGARICPPYRFAIPRGLRIGENLLRIELTNTLAEQLGDNEFDRSAALGPVGLSGPVMLTIWT